MFNTVQLNGLALEYKGEYGTARRYVDITDVVNYPLGGRVGRVFGPGFFEKVECLPLVQVGTLRDHAGDSLLISDD